jgi:hypothetical protein
MAPANSLSARGDAVIESQPAPRGDPAKAWGQLDIAAATAFRDGLAVTIAGTGAIRERILRCMLRHPRLMPGLCAALE